tara:strand:- start:56 stop:364 length:309 start_codon:yes stop_codon:yes gene_type:complete
LISIGDDSKTGVVMLILCLVALPVTGFTMDDWDASERMYERDCDVVFRILYLGIDEPIDPIKCDILKEEKQQNLRIFILSLSIFIGTGVSGLSLILPYGEKE